MTSFGYRPFNSPQHIITARDGSLWFTDPPSGADSGIRPPPQLPAHVYRFDLETASSRVLVDGLQRPTGLCFDPTEQTLYVTDVGIAGGEGEDVGPNRYAAPCARLPSRTRLKLSLV